MGKKKRLVGEDWLLLNTPKAYVDLRSPIADFGMAVEGEECLYEVTVISINRRYKNNRGYSILKLFDANNNHAYATIFQPEVMWRENYPLGESLYVKAVAKRGEDVTFLQNIEVVDPACVGTVQPIYPAIRGKYSSKALAKRIRAELPVCAAATVEKITATLADTQARIAQKIGYSSLDHWLSDLHQPQAPELGKSALLAARLLAKMQVIHAAKNAQQKSPIPKSAMALGSYPFKGLTLPFELSQEQHEVVSKINLELNSPYPLDGLLNADVGCGKTICYAIPTVIAYRAGYQCCVLAPATLLVKQIARFIRQTFPDVCIEEIVAGQAIQNEKAILVGTVALLTAAKKKKYKPNLLVIDEQQRFSLAQRNELKADFTNVLQVTATAIPRELALVEHAGKPVYLITKPPVAKTIHTRVVTKGQRSELFEYLRGFADRGKQQAIIYPKLKGKGARTGLMHVFEYWEKHYPGLVVKIHGQQDEVENLAAMKRMEEKTALILIASTAIEVGIDLPDLKALTIIEPQHFGIAQLHQLRGRAARRGGTGYCLLYQGEEVTDETMSRIKLLEKHPDGFSIALADMENRGFGQFDESEDTQSGKTYSMFPQIHFTPQELREVADAINGDAPSV